VDVRKILYFAIKNTKMTANELIQTANTYSVVERLKIVEGILKKIREDDLPEKEATHTVSQNSGILAFAGIWSEEEASVFESAVQESRKIDTNEW